MLAGIAAGMTGQRADVYIVMPNLCRSGQTCGHHIAAITSRERLGVDFTSDFVIRQEQRNVRWRMISWLDERKDAEEILASADVLVVLGSALMYCASLNELVVMVSKNRGRRVLVLPFPLIEVEYYAGVSRANWLFSRLRHIVDMAEEVFVSSDYCARELAQRAFSSRPVRTVRLGVDDQWRGIRGYKHKHYLICIGRMTRLASHKNIDILLDAWQLLQRKLAGVQLVLIGHGSKNIAAGHKDVLTIENADDLLVGRYLARALALVHPSTIEAFGLSVAEGLAAGLPVIGTRATAIPELVSDGTNGLLVTPDGSLPLGHRPRLDPNRLCESLLAITQDAELRHALASNSSLSVEDLTWSKTATAYLGH